MERVFKVGLLLLLAATGLAVRAPAEDPVFEVDGMGFFGDRRMVNLAWTLRSEDAPDDYLDVSFIENALYLIDARLASQGFLRPSYHIEIDPVDAAAQPLNVRWRGEDLLDVPTDIQARRVHVDVDKGQFYKYRNLSFTGLNVIPHAEATDFFFKDHFLLQRDHARAFSPSGMQRSARSLQSVLLDKGYQNATVDARLQRQNNRTGDVDVVVTVDEGLEHRVRHVSIVLDGYTSVPGVEGVAFDTQQGIGAPFSLVWQQDYGRSILQHFYKAGYAQADARFVVTNREMLGGRVLVDGELHIRPGPRIRVGEVTFPGRERTVYSVLDRRVQTDPGVWLNPVQLDKDRFRLAQLGVFADVDASYELGAQTAPPVDGAPPETTSQVGFAVTPKDRLEVDLLLGYGSYDKLCGGFEITRENLWGRAHSDRLLLVQSFVSTLVEYRYRMPEFFDINNDLTARLRWLRREEISFTRREYGAELRLSRDLQDIDGANVSVGYRLQRVEAVGLEAQGLLEEARVGSLFANFTIDRLDNPIFPEQGWNLRSEAQAGATVLGGEVDFQSLLVEGSYHRRISDTTLFHAALSVGMVGSFSGQAGNIPINERFFPGGEDSIRGYTEGEASPLNAAGEQIGAENYLQPTLELEQFFAESFSGVVFADGLAQSADWANFLGEDFLLTVGLGLRYRTVVGPVRLEGGYNVIRRDEDPSWTVHLSLGYPF